MPEFPEVNIIADTVRDKILGKKLIGILLHSGSRYCKNGLLNLLVEIEFTKPQKTEDNDYFYNLVGEVIDVFTYGKKIFIKIKNGDTQYYITSFLSLHGTWRFDKDFDAKHTIIFKDDTSEFGLFYHDKRNWGIFSIVKDYKSILKDVGPDFFSEEGTLEYFKSVVKRPKLSEKDIGWFMMEQTKF